MGIREVIGSGAKFRALLDQVNVVAPVDSTVLIQGEIGTGKELIARAIHEASPRPREWRRRKRWFGCDGSVNASTR